MDQIESKFATLNSEQIQQLVENYAERIVDDMDTKTLMQFAYDTIVENLNIQSPNDILGEIGYVYDDEIVEQLIDGVMN